MLLACVAVLMPRATGDQEVSAFLISFAYLLGFMCAEPAAGVVGFQL